MKRNKLFILFSLSILSVYVIGRMGSISVADATDATQVAPKSMAPAVPASAGGLQVKVLNTSVMQPSQSDQAMIQNGTFNSTNPAATRCPNVLSCGTPNNPLVGTSTCPNVCYVTAASGGAPPAQPYLYTQCPSGYAALTTGRSDLRYQWQNAISAWPNSQTQMQSYQAQGYTCGPIASTQITTCPDTGNTGDYVIRSGQFYQVTNYWCMSNGSGTYCNWTVSCSVANVQKLFLQRVRCDRVAGYYPVTVQYNPNGSGSSPSYETMPLDVICGRVSTTWTNG